ncbi:SDR family NAD(P)-dependent oxidoreductase [Leifsonia sp. YAF41]|uniref:SDR family NAD(P)-dependent oxidoreductase n=1 Tax=Leifsonia sp. YAF41 TaxID=3233086 RepID=UPI003F9BFD99
MTDRQTPEAYWGSRACVVTGAARGQGAAAVRLLLSLGASVIAVDQIPDDSADWDELRAGLCPGALLVPLEGDVAEQQTWDRALSAIESTDRPLAGLLNNAGITLRKTVTETTLQEWDHVLRVNLTGGFLAIRALADVMEDGGAIVNVSSTAGLTGYFSAAYTASKWAVRGLAQAAAIELAPRGIRVNTICPGLVDTAMAMGANAVYDATQAAAFYEGNREMTPLGRGAAPEEIADAAVFLLGPNASFITATDLVVDGGMIGGGIYSFIGRKTGTIASRQPQA